MAASTARQIQSQVEGFLQNSGGTLQSAFDAVKGFVTVNLSQVPWDEIPHRAKEFLDTHPQLADKVKQVNWENVVESAKEVVENHPQFSGNLADISWDEIPETAKNWVCGNPQAFVVLILVLIAIIPGLLVSPALGVLGFGSLGPVGGKNNVSRTNCVLSRN